MLPTSKTEPSTSISDLTVLLYGLSKIGKSTFCSKAEDVIFLATEPGLNSLEVYKVNIESWYDLQVACGDLAKGDHKFKTVVIDTVDQAFKMCSDYMCKKYKVGHVGDDKQKDGITPSGLSYGKGYSLLNNEFSRVLTKLAFLPYGLVLISHAKEIDLESQLIPKVTTTLPARASEIVTGLVDIILYCELETNEDGTEARRVMRTRPSLSYDAGDRTGRLPETLPLDYHAFAEALKVGK